MGVKIDDKLCANAVSKHVVSVGVSRDAKLGIKSDATLGTNDESNHGIDMIAK